MKTSSLSSVLLLALPMLLSPASAKETPEEVAAQEKIRADIPLGREF
jgi:hypothetical protein